MLSRLGPMAIACALVALAVAATPAPAGADTTDDEAGPGTVTTVLQPGWNMVGWLGDAVPVAAVFQRIPQLQRVLAWDAEEQRFQRGTRTSTTQHGLRQLTPGAGLWFYIGGTRPVELSGTAWGDSRLLSLGTGRNLVTWTGPDGTPVEDALGRFEHTLVHAARWNAVTRQYEGYRPGSEDGASTLRELNHGDALWVHLSEPGRWWQPGLAEPAINFLATDPDIDQQHLRTTLNNARAVIAERFGEDTAALEVDVGTQRCGASPRRIILTISCAGDDWIMAHEYFHVLQYALADPRSLGPSWLTEGAAMYATSAFMAASEPESSFSDVLSRRRTYALTRIKETTAALSSIEDSAVFYNPVEEDVNYRMGFFAADWLVGLTGEEPLIDYYRRLSASPDWKSAFRDAFGLTTEEFYKAFATHRAAVAPPLPHLTDDRQEPVVVVLGDVTEDAAAALRGELAEVRTFLRDRFGEEADYTLYVGADLESIRPAYRALRGRDPDQHYCGESGERFGILVLSCAERAPAVEDAHMSALLSRVTGATRWAMPGAEIDEDPRGPRWLVEGAWEYVSSAYSFAQRSSHDEYVLAAKALPVPLRELVSRDRFVPIRPATSLSFLAVEWLANHAGDHAIFDYYEQLLPLPGRWERHTVRWDDVFERTFGIAVEQFYTEFEAYFASLNPELPPLTRDGDEAVVVFLGEVPEDERARIEMDLRDALTFFSDRFGVGPVNFTLYVGADVEALSATHEERFGRKAPDSYCAYGSEAFAIVGPQCTSTSIVVGQYVFGLLRHVVGATRGTRPGSGNESPRWLIDGTREYVESLYPEERRASRDTHISDATRTALQLRGMETHEGAGAVFRTRAYGGLSFLAVEWLAHHAGDQALFDYHRRVRWATDWRAAFEEAFGIAVGDFYDAFEAHRAEVAPPIELYRIHGVVLGLDGEPLSGTAWVLAYTESGAYEDGGPTESDGTFELAVTSGRYSLSTTPAGGQCQLPQGVTDVRTSLEVDGADVSGIEIRLPEGTVCLDPEARSTVEPPHAASLTLRGGQP